ncbi:MAG: 4Fe-4S ferredoxin [Thermoprotei archaeon]|nr:MAG: 4Fe-4S ferredoxin [Thermoprotei archaeon]RLE88488.1 MAG: 4Fe-4S ferredoxin [Thermoprotei archaeon]
MEYPVYRRLMTVNVASRTIRRVRKLLLYGTCVRDEYPELFESVARDRVSLAVCLEDEHMNTVALKLASILARVPLDEVVVLTVDGSPHCIQLHMLVEEVSKIIGGFKRVHLVVENGKLIEIPEECVKICRYLTKIKRMLTKPF